MTEIDPHGLRLGDPDAAPVARFTLDGRPMTGVAGEPIAAALHAQGVRVLGRSFKYRRPRGLHCVGDACPSCAMRVNGLPGVATCATPLRDGDRVERQKGTPSADRDVLAATDRMSRLVPVGFQYRHLRRSPRLFEHWERLLARLAGTGRIADAEAAAAVAANAGFSSRTADVAVIGGGVAGLSAALAAAEAGAEVVLLERRAALGGWVASVGRAAERGRAQELEGQVREHPRIAALTGATASAWLAEEVLAVTSADGLMELQAKAYVLAAGAHERPAAFADNDRPGVMLAAGVHRLVAEHRLRPGRRVVVVTDEDYGHVVAAELVGHGIETVAVADARGDLGAEALAVAGVLDHGGVRCLTRTTPAAAQGRKLVTGVTLDVGGRAEPETLACDTIAVAYGRRPARELLRQRLATGGLALAVPADAFAPVVDPSRPVAGGWWLAGAVGGAATVAEAMEAGARAGAAATGGGR